MKSFIQQKTNRSVVLATVMVAMFITAIEATIVSTAMPSIVSELGGFQSYALVFSIFLLMQAVTIPIYGKLSDLFGRKPVFTFGMVVFLIGSVLCGFATSMLTLVVYRLIQGIGAGAVQPLAMTIVSDIYPLEERGRVQGYLSSVWAVSSVTGPALGGIFVQYVGWEWVFWINVPFGILTLFGLHLFFREEIDKTKPQIDYSGSLLLLITIGSLMTLFIGSGSLWSWQSEPFFILAVVFVIGLTAFIRRQQVAPEPLMPLSLWQNRTIVLSNLTALTSHMVLIGISTFLPTYVQGVMEYSPSIAGLTLGMMSIGWPLASTLGGRFMHRIGLRRMSVSGSVAIILGTIVFMFLKPEFGPVYAGSGAFLTGVGLGLLSTASMLIVQGSTEWKVRGSATALIMFMRISGSTIGASILASILNTRYASYMRENADTANIPVNIDDANMLLDPNRPVIDESVIALLKGGLVHGLNSVYVSTFLLALITFLLIVWLPQTKVTSPWQRNKSAEGQGS